MQAVEEVLPVDGLNVPAVHLMQAVEEVLPVNGLYDPAVHAVHAAWPDELYSL
jgi:hypothetical protein